jgi:predicted transcriptional regulator of viral defense system
MRFLELKKQLGDQLVFTFSDARKIDGGFDYRRLTEWQKKNYIKKIIKGYYIFSDTALSEEVLFSVANKIYSPSYISLESALRYYNLIPEGVFQIISVSTKKTACFQTQIGTFTYRKISPGCFFDYTILGNGPQKVKIATPEKAIADFFYLNAHLKSPADITSLRINKGSFSEKVNIKKLEENVSKIGNKRLKERINILLKTVKDA